MYGELSLPTLVRTPGRNAQNGQFLKGRTPHNKGKSWKEQRIPKSSQRRMAIGWKNLELHRPKTRPDNAGRCRKPVVAIDKEGRLYTFLSISHAAEITGGQRANIRRCCKENFESIPSPKRGTINTDHEYVNLRFYYESDPQWINKTNNH